MNRSKRRDMERRMRRDGRNPWGSRGGYVTSGRDRARGRRDYNRDYDMEYYDDTEYDRPYNRDGHYMPFEMRGGVGMRNDDYDYRRRDYARRGGRRDYGHYEDYSDEDYLDDRELMEWSKDLLKEVDPSYKDFFTIENIEKKAKEMGIEFDKFTFEEFYVTVLMVFTDYFKTLGAGNMDTYLRLAKDWLCDEDAELQYGEKLAVYYNEIVD